jgi:hypothetical protein
MKKLDPVLIGNHTITFEFTHMDDRHGDFCSKQLLIRLSDKLEGWGLIETLIHEISHAIYWSFSMSDDDEEERNVSVYATGITQVIRDNPHLIKFIRKSAYS